MDWATFLPALSALLAKLTGLQDFERDSPPKFTDPVLKAKLEFAVTSCIAVGRDERRYVYSPTDPDLNKRVTLTIEGNREFALTVKCISYDHSPLKSAEYYLERIYTKLSWPSSQQALNDAGMSFMHADNFINISQALSPEDRAFSMGVKDFHFLAAVVDVDSPDSADSPIGTIDEVELTSIYLFDVSGDPLGKQIGPVVIP